MTIIAYRDGIMAADSGRWAHGLMIGTTQKITRTPAGVLVGCAGDAQLIKLFREWADAGMFPESRRKLDGSFAAITVTPEGVVHTWDNECVPLDLTAEFYACGAGVPTAFGAMAMGATAEQAVEVACRYDESCRGPIISMRIGK